MIHAGGLARSFRTRRGTVEAVCGVDTHVAPGCDLLRDPVGVRRRIGYVGQAGGAGPDCPALDELVLQGRLYGMPAQRAYVRGRELLGQLELTGTPTSSNGPSRATPLNWAPTRRGTPRSSPGRRPAPPGWLYRAPPCGSVSGILLPMSLAPLWFYTVSRFNPFVYVVDATRAEFVGDLHGTTVLLGVLAAVGLSIVAVSFGVRTFRRQNA